MSYSRANEYSENAQLISILSKATSHPARLLILNQLATEPLTLRQLLEDHPIKRVTLMKHLNFLISLGLINIESHDSPAIYTTNPNHWPTLITYAVGLANRFIHANAA